eukprot:626676-Karenia_brevis.AAC.1
MAALKLITSSDRSRPVHLVEQWRHTLPLITYGPYHPEVWGSPQRLFEACLPLGWHLLRGRLLKPPQYCSRILPVKGCRQSLSNTEAGNLAALIPRCT